MFLKNKRFRIAVGCFALWMLLGFLCAPLFHTLNWLGVVHAHIVLGVTDKNRCQIAAWTYLVKEIDVVLSDLEQQGWRMMAQDERSYLLQKNTDYRWVILEKQVITGYDLVVIGDEFDDPSEIKLYQKNVQ